MKSAFFPHVYSDRLQLIKPNEEEKPPGRQKCSLNKHSFVLNPRTRRRKILLKVLQRGERGTFKHEWNIRRISLK